MFAEKGIQLGLNFFFHRVPVFREPREAFPVVFARIGNFKLRVFFRKEKHERFVRNADHFG